MKEHFIMNLNLFALPERMTDLDNDIKEAAYIVHSERQLESVMAMYLRDIRDTQKDIAESLRIIAGRS